MTERPKIIRCAVYTRKSSEEGLDQSFNSLHAQREACEAYVLSQKHEGWQLLPAAYDDGGFSGGNMDRPGLKKLLADITAGKVDTVVVYKVDRLTRALSDFARIVESFDSKGVSFVSVTQQFNTTSSMGRLTLNVLLSFAQFEREVTGERIRDKVAASKRKGMWMGGHIPLGYDAKDRCLVVNEEEAETVRLIFREYLRLGSVAELQIRLNVMGVRSKRRLASTGQAAGGCELSRGTLYHLLSSQLYIGKIVHKGTVYQGLHRPIIDPKTWAATTSLLKENGIRRLTSKNLPSGRLLLGIMTHADGGRFVPTHASKKGRRYAYYVVPAKPGEPARRTRRLPAIEIEHAVTAVVRSFLLSGVALAKQFPSMQVRQLRLLVSAAQHRAEVLTEASGGSVQLLRNIISAVVVDESELRVLVNPAHLHAELLSEEMEGTLADIELSCPFRENRSGREVRIILSNGLEKEKPNLLLINVIARARDWAERIASGEIETMAELVQYSGLTKQYARRVLRCAAVSPMIMRSVLDGGRHQDETVSAFMSNVQSDWRASLE